MRLLRLAGMVRYEGMMLWRRRGLLVLTVVVLAGLVLGALQVGLTWLAAWAWIRRTEGRGR